MALSRIVSSELSWRDPVPWALFAFSIGLSSIFCSAIPLLVPADGAAYYQAATKLIHGPRAAAIFDPWRSPGYPLWLAVTIVTFGVLPSAVIGGQVLLSAISATLYYRLGALLSGRIAGTLAGLFVALHPALLALDHIVLSETLALCVQGVFLCGAVSLMQSFGENGGSLAKAGLVGLSGALMVLIRPSQLPLLMALGGTGLLFAGVSFFTNRVRAGRIITATTVVILVCLVLLSPWFIERFRTQRLVAVSGVAHIGRFVFGLGSGFISPASSELLALVPDLPNRWAVDRQGAAWEVVSRKRMTGASEREINQWAHGVVNRELLQYPWAFCAASARTLGSIMGFRDGRIGELDYFILKVFADPSEHKIVSLLVKDQVPSSLISGCCFEGRRSVLLRWYEWGSQWRYPLLFLLFLLVLPASFLRADLSFVALSSLAMTATLVLVLAPVDRYLVMNEPLIWVAVVGTVSSIFSKNLVSSRRRRLGAALLFVGGPLVAAAVSYAGTAGATRFEERAFRALTMKGVDSDAETLWRYMFLSAERNDWAASLYAWKRLRRQVPELEPPRKALDHIRLEALARGPNLLQNGSFQDGMAGWNTPPGSTSKIRVQHRSGEAYAHILYSSGNWEPLSQTVELRPDALYVFETELRSTAPLITLYWEVDSGRSLQAGKIHKNWTRLRYSFVTPHWGGKARHAVLAPALIQGPGEVFIRDVSLREVALLPSGGRERSRP